MEGSTIMEAPRLWGPWRQGRWDSVASGEPAEKQAAQHDSPVGAATPFSPRRCVSALSRGGIMLQSQQTPTLPSAGNTKLTGFRRNLAAPPDCASGAPPPLTPRGPSPPGGPHASSVESRSSATSGYLIWIYA
jgi:hypothetical protein